MGDVVLEDRFDFDDRWEAVLLLEPPNTGWTHTIERRVSGGNPGGYRHLKHITSATTNPDFTTIWVRHFYGGALKAGSVTYDAANGSYDPRALGAIDSIQLNLDRFSIGTVAETFVIEQGAAVYETNILGAPEFNSANWSSVSQRLTRADFGPGLDFTATGLPMRFGVKRGNTARFPVANDHGLDNFRIVIKRH